MPNEIEKNEERDVLNFEMALRYANTAKLILADLKKNNKETTFFSKYSKEDIVRWLKNPESNAKQLRNASIYLYNASSHYARLINYFGKMPLYAYTVVPYRLDINKVDKTKFLKQYKAVTDKLDNMNIQHEFGKVINTCFREDIFYGYEYSTNESYFIKKLPPDYCEISSIEDGVYNIAFDFSYFNSRREKLESWGKEFSDKFKKYKNDGSLRWQELDSTKTICIKINEDIDYPIPPFIGVLGSLYDLEDFKALRKAGEEISNYKMLSLKIPLDAQGQYLIPYDEAKKFYMQLGNVLPENIGAILTPMEIGEHKFEKAGTSSQINSVADAEQQLWNSAGVSQLLFNSEKSSSATIGNSIKSDEEYVFALLTQIERWINRKLKYESGQYKFKINMLRLTIYNQKEMVEQYIKAGQVGAPVKMAISACLGYTPNDTLNMCFLENDVLELHNKYIVLSSSHTQSGSTDVTNSGGAPKVDDNELSDAGAQTRENDNRTSE